MEVQCGSAVIINYLKTKSNILMMRVKYFNNAVNSFSVYFFPVCYQGKLEVCFMSSYIPFLSQSLTVAALAQFKY